MIVGVWGVRAIYIAATAGGLGFGILLWSNRDKKGALPLCVENVAAAFWAFCVLLSTLPVDWLANAAVRVVYLGVGVTVATTLVFALEYTDRERYISRRMLAVLAIQPILVVVAAILNPGGLFFTDIVVSGVAGVDQEWGGTLLGALGVQLRTRRALYGAASRVYLPR